MNLAWTQSSFYKRLSGPNLFNWKLFFWSYVFLFIPQILFDIFAYESPTWLWLPVWTAVHLVVAGIAALVRLLGFDALQARRRSAMLNLILASVLGVVRVVGVGYVSFEIGIGRDFLLEARIISGVILGVIVFVFITIILESDRSYATSLRRLTTAQDQLLQMRKIAKKEVEEAHRDLTRKTREVVEPRLADIARLLKAQNLQPAMRRQVTKSLVDILKNQVAPLNKTLRSASKSLGNPRTYRGVSRARLYQIPALAKPDLAISPAWMLFVLLGVYPFSLYIFEDQSWLWLGFLMAFLSYGLIFLAKGYLRKTDAVPVKTAIAQLLVGSVQLTILNFVGLLTAGFPVESASFVSFIVFLALVFTVSGMGLVVTHEYNQEDFLAKLRKNNARVEAELGLLNQKLWVERRRWALTIHGTVQASLTAALARLKASDQLTPSEIKRIAQHVDQAKRGLSGPKTRTFDLPIALKQQVNTWRDIIDVKVDTKSENFALLSKDIWASYCANEIIKEALSNAFKHGGASKVGVSFETENQGFITIQVSNNGRTVSRRPQKGLGSQLLNEIAFPWSLTPDPKGGAILRARIPLAKKARARTRV